MKRAWLVRVNIFGVRVKVHFDFKRCGAQCTSSTYRIMQVEAANPMGS